jgi:PAS domain S-box-containing protein
MPDKSVFTGFDPLLDLIDNTSEVVMLLGPDYNFLFVNRAFRETFSYSTEEIMRMKFPDLLHPSSKDEVMEVLKQVKRGHKVTDFQIITRNKEEKRIYLLGEITGRFEKGRLINLRLLFRDITQRRRAERAQNLYYSIAQANLNTYDLKEFLKRVHEELQKKLYANNFFVAIYEPENGSIYFPYRVDEHYETPEDDRRKLGNGIVEYAMLKNQPLLLYKDEFEALVKQEKLFLYGKELPEIQAIVPLRVDNKVTGVIGIKSYSDATKFSSSNLELLEFISGQVAQALARKKSQEDLLLQTARLNALFDNSSHLIWTVNRKRHLSSFNKNYSNLIKEKLGTLPDINISTEKLGWRLIAPGDRPLLREKYNLAFEGNPQYFEMHWGDIDGGDQWYEFILNPILSSETGEVEEVSGMAQNITYKKIAVLNLQRSEEKFRNIIESFIDIYYRTDLAGNITMISPSVLTHTGYTVEEVMGNKVDKFFDNAEDSTANIKTLLKSGSVINFDVTVRRKDGELRSFMLNIRMIKDGKGFPVEIEGVARDITELKKSSKELQIAKEEAEYSLAVKERFLANMSHEIRTPMNGIIGMLDVLNETPLQAEQQDYVNTIRKSSQTLLTILNDILDLSKIEAGKMNLHPVVFELKETLDTLVALFQQRAFEKGNTLKYEIGKDVPIYLKADQTRLLQVLSNLTSNAIKFTDNSPINITVNVKRKADSEVTLYFEVIDHGIGITAEDQKKLFSAFQQLDNSTSKSFGGTGLGLAISRELCKRMNGEMGLVSSPGEGSTFWFTIEAEISNESPAATKKEQGEIQLSGYFKDIHPHLLLVDDNAVNRKVAREILQRAGCVITEADSGKKALKAFEENPGFNLILMDIQMPEMDGIETTATLRELYGDALPNIVAMTAYSMQNDREKFLNSGFNGYVSKPIRAHTLILVVEEMMNKKSDDSGTELMTSTALPEEPSSVPAFDMEIINGLKEMVGAEMLQSVFEDFAGEAQEQISKSEEAFNNKDVITIQKELHTLKGNSGTIGLMRIHELVKEIEVPAKTGNLEGFEEKFETLKKEFEFFLQNHKSV